MKYLVYKSSWDKPQFAQTVSMNLRHKIDKGYLFVPTRPQINYCKAVC